MACIPQMLVCLVVVGLTAVNSYPYGPPLGSCSDMYPTGHKVDSQMSASIVTIKLKTASGAETTTYTAGEVITVTVETANQTDTSVYYEGLFVQARDTNCTGNPIGTFQIIGTSDFLKTMNCAGMNKSAISHKNHTHQLTQTFTWTAPSPAVGHIYFQATVVRNTKTFWAGVKSAFLKDASDKTVAKYCKIRMTVGKAADSKATIAVVLLGLTIAVANVISFS